MSRGIFFIVIVLIASSVHANLLNISIENFSVLHGLPQSNITSIHQDQMGFLWVGTSDGLVRYNGYQFYDVHKESLQLTNNKGDYILDILSDKQGNIWFITDYGIEKISILRNSVIHKRKASDKPYKKLTISTNSKVFIVNNGKQIFDFSASLNNTDSILKPKIIFDHSGSPVNHYLENDLLWITQGNNIYKINIGANSNSNAASDIRYVSSEQIKDVVIPNESNLIYLITEKSIEVLNRQSMLLVDKVVLTLSLTNRGATIVNAFHKKDYILLNSSNSIKKYSITENKFTNLPLFEIAGRTLTVSEVIQDNTGLIWAASTKGLYKINPNAQGFRSHILNRGVNAFDGLEFITSSSENAFLVKNSEYNNYQCFPSDYISHKILSSRWFQGVIAFDKTSNSEFVVLNKQGGFKLSENKIDTVFLDLGQLDIKNAIHFNNHILIASSSGIYYSAFNAQQTLQKISAVNDIHLLSKNKNNVFLANKKDLFKLTSDNKLTILWSLSNINENNEINDILPLKDGNILIATNNGLYHQIQNKQSQETFYHLSSLTCHSLIEDEGSIWITTDNAILKYQIKGKELHRFTSTDGISNLNFIKGAGIKYAKNQVAFGNTNGLTYFHTDSIPLNNTTSPIHFLRAVLQKEKGQQQFVVADNDTININTRDDYLEVFFALMDYHSPYENTFEYSITTRKDKSEWTNISGNNSVVLSKLMAGKHYLKVQGRNNHGVLSSNVASIVINVETPMWKSRVAILIYGGIGIFIVYLIIIFRTSQLQKVNKEYKEKEHIAKKIQRQKEELTLKNKNITDSINYARRIQMAMMPSEKNFKSYFNDSFILYLPKDIVSGDFYWVNEVDERIYFSAVDCTGHGVPGAFMSIIGFELFRRITEREKVVEPGSILNQLSYDLQSLFVDENNKHLHDGMDLAFCSIDKKHKTLQYAGAFNPLYIVRNNSIIEYKGNRFSVGWNGDDIGEQIFQNHTIKLEDGDVIYIFTDGYADQFGGPEGKKYKYRRFRHLLLALHQLSMERQVDFLKKSITEWRGNLEQVDDILVIGIRINQKK